MLNAIIFRIKRNVYRYFFFRLFVFTVIVALFDYGIGSMLEYFYFKQTSGVQFRTTYSIEKTTADVLIIGTSRAGHDYRPDIFGHRLNLSCYDVGRDASYIFYQYAVLTAILKRYSPKMIILDFLNGEFKLDRESYDRLQSLLPYYKTHPEIRPMIELKSPFEKIKLLSRIYPFNSSILTIAAGNTEFNKKRSGDFDGYVGLTKGWNEPIKSADNAWTAYIVDSTKIKILEAFIKDCIQAKVKLYIVCSPYFIKKEKMDYSIACGMKIAKKYNIAFYDFSRDSTFLANPKFFADEIHLNDSGAQVFSNLLIDKILIR
jgi:hypothetical protein